MMNYAIQREKMVDQQIKARGVRSEKVLDAMRKVPRERFLPSDLAEFAYEDSPLPIADGQTISQPYIVAFMVEGLALQGGEKVLEIGAGSGYAAAVLGEVAGEVISIERIESLAHQAASVLVDLGYDNVRVLHSDGTLGLAEEAPFDAIVVTAGGPEVPHSLKQQLKIGGRLLIPVGTSRDFQELLRITRVSETEFEQEDLADVRFVPLVGDQGWDSPVDVSSGSTPRIARDDSSEISLLAAISDHCNPFESIETANLDPLLERIGNSDIVLIGEASHGTSEFYKMRCRITRDLIVKKGFDFVAIEGDWPDAAHIDNYVRHFDTPPSEWTAFARFPTWMWRNNEVREFVDWLHIQNSGFPPDKRVAFHGLDLYSLYSSIRAVLKYLDEVDPETAAKARHRYGCLTPWQADPATYGRAAISGTYRSCEDDVVQMLTELSGKHREYAEHDGVRFLDAVQNARLVANAERYYRVMYYGSRESWNLRDSYMFETLKTLRDFHWPDNKTIVWAHNSHVGNSNATEMSYRGEFNIGHLCKKEFGDRVYTIGFGTDRGTVAAASDWDGQMEVKTVRPALANSYEHLFHKTGLPGFTLGLRAPEAEEVRQGLAFRRLQRAIGVIYRPETERASHYFSASLAHQFDEYIWIDQTTAVQPFDTAELEGVPDTYPFGL
jgi:protein-L-isoaspartate(D-aspartate) O-methyltransferase